MHFLTFYFSSFCVSVEHDYPADDEWGATIDTTLRKPPVEEGGRFAKCRTLADVVNRSPSYWSGGLYFKKYFIPAKLHPTSGEASVVDVLLEEELRFTNQLILQPCYRKYDVLRRITVSVSHAIFLCLPETTVAAAIPTSNEATVQNRPLRHFVKHLKKPTRRSLGHRCVRRNAYIKRLLSPATPSLADETLKDHLAMVVVEETPTASEMELFLILNSLNLSLFVSTLHSQLAPIPSLNYLLGWGTLLGFTKSLLVLLRQTSSYSPTTSREKLSSRNQ